VDSDPRPDQDQSPDPVGENGELRDVRRWFYRLLQSCHGQTAYFGLWYADGYSMRGYPEARLAQPDYGSGLRIKLLLHCLTDAGLSVPELADPALQWGPALMRAVRSGSLRRISRQQHYEATHPGVPLIIEEPSREKPHADFEAEYQRALEAGHVKIKGKR